MNAIIIDDEALSRNVLKKLINRYVDQVNILAEFEDPGQAQNFIISHSLDLVFLDIRMPGMNGFELLDSIPEEHLNFFTIFTTSYDQYAIRAIKYSAFDYLLKPIDESELIACIEKLENRISKDQINSLKDNFSTSRLRSKITIGHSKGLSFINVEDIILMVSDNNYTNIYYNQNIGHILSSKTLGYYVKLLEDHPNFFRSHKQFLINTDHIIEYQGGDDNTILLNHGFQARLSRSRKSLFLSKFR